MTTKQLIARIIVTCFCLAFFALAVVAFGFKIVLSLLLVFLIFLIVSWAFAEV